MDGTLSSNPPPSPSGRPRLTPGIPAGGIAAILVALGVMGWSVLAGDAGDKGNSPFRIVAPIPPAPPMPPLPPMPAAPRSPDVRANVDPAEIERAVQEAMRGVDMDATRMEALRAAQQGLAEAQRGLAEARERLQAEGREMPAIAQGALRIAEMGVAAASGAASGAGGGTGVNINSDPEGGSFLQSFDAPKGVQFANITGNITVERSSRASKVRLEVEGGGMNAEVRDGVLTVRAIEGGRPAEINLTMPDKGDLTVVGLTGDLNVGGRSGGKLTVQLKRGDISAERVDALSVDIQERGSVSVQRVDGPLRFGVSGMGELSVERVETAQIEVRGRGTVSLGRVNDGLTLSLPGQAEIDIGRVNGAVKADFPGAGRVSIGEGDAEPLQLTLTGSGKFEFNGTAHDPRISASGSGNVYIARHQGQANVRNTGSGTTYVGE
ncbi:GIN domain-containing protein [Niveispirillum fermenti]|uniref:GIN domain-containing protein n=1 Tax=Niveispirillum fermenti TaxID=1233113 RepID=UPI003A8B8BEF